MSRLFNFYRVFIITITLFLVCIASRVNAADSDNFTLTLSAGTPTVAPNPAAVHETATFRFTVTLHGNGQHVEEVPPGIKEIQYTVNCADGIITANNPDMLISADKHSASKTVKQLYSSVSSSTQFPQTGDFSLSLSVTVIFMDNSFLFFSQSLFVKVVSATLTVYAKKPNKIVTLYGPLGKPIPHCVNTGDGGVVGHSFWKCEVGNLNLGFSVEEKMISGHKYGFYPNEDIPEGLKVLKNLSGILSNDDTHESSASKSYSINIGNAHNVLGKTIDLLKSKSLKYNLINQTAHNCTGQCVNISNNVAGCKAPEGKGLMGVVQAENDKNGIFYPFVFANPYHHTIQIQSAK
jgi:hypothetical protein